MVKSKRLRESMMNHFKTNMGLYLLVLFFFAVGVAAGTFTVKALDDVQKQSLIKYLQGFFQVLTSQEIDSGAVLRQSINNNMQTLVIIWILGITVIGIPLTLLAIGIRGFIIGFTVGFLIDGLGAKGLIFTLLAVIPQNIIVIPCIIASCVLSVGFSVAIIRERMSRRRTSSYWQKLASYLLVVVILFTVSICGSLIEAYITPVFIKLVSSYLTA